MQTSLRDRARSCFMLPSDCDCELALQLGDACHDCRTRCTPPNNLLMCKELLHDTPLSRASSSRRAMLRSSRSCSKPMARKGRSGGCLTQTPRGGCRCCADVLARAKARACRVVTSSNTAQRPRRREHSFSAPFALSCAR